MAFLTITQIKAMTDRYAGIYEVAAAALPSLLAKMQADEAAVYGLGVASLGDPAAINAFGPVAIAGVSTVNGSAIYTLLMAQKVAALSSYLQRYGGAAAGLPASVVDAASYVRYANGCPDPSPLGNGAGSSFTHLLHPSYAALVSAMTNGVSFLPPDVVFAPGGLSVAYFAFGGLPGGLSQPGVLNKARAAGGLPYAPLKSFAASLGITDGGAAVAAPNGTLYVTLTGVSHTGTTKTWRGEVTAGTLQGTAGGANGGTAAASDRLASVTSIVRDTSVASGGTATSGGFTLAAVAERASL